MFKPLRNRFLLLSFAILIFSLMGIAQDSIPTLDLSPLFTRTKDLEQYEDAAFAEKRLYASSIDSLWSSTYGSENFDLSDFLNDLIMLKLKKGLNRIPDFSKALCYHISKFIINSNLSRDEINHLDENIDKILVVDPYSAEAHTLKSKITLKKSIIYFIPAIYYYIKGLLANFALVDDISIYIPSLIYYIHFAAFLSGFIFFIILLIKYIPLLVHEAHEILHITPVSRFFILAAIGITAFWFYAGMIPSMIFLTALIFVYTNNFERAIIILCFFSLILSILTFDYFSKYALLSESDITKALINSYSIEYDPYSVLILEEYQKKHNDNTAVNFTLANYYSRKGKIFPALTLYNAIEQKRTFPELYINIGNLYYILNDYYKAQSYYEKVTDKSELQGLASFNLAQMSLEKLTFSQDTHKYFDLTKEYSPDLVDLYQKISHKHINLIISTGLPAELLFEHMQSEMQKQDRAVHISVFGMNPDQMPYIGTLSLVFILIVNLFRIRMDLAFKCRRCGKIFCSRCSTKFFSETMCPSCHQVFIIKKGIHPKVRVEKIINIDKYKKNKLLLSRLLTVLTLGGGYILFDKVFKGFFLIFFYISVFILLFGIVPIFPGYKLPFVTDYMLGKIFLGFIMLIILFNSIKSMDKLSQKYHSEK